MKLIFSSLAVYATLFASLSNALPTEHNLAVRDTAVSPQAAKTKLVPIPGATQFCINYLKGQTPPQSTTTLSPSTQTVTSTPLSTTTVSSTVQTTVTSTSIATSTPVTTTTSTAPGSTITSQSTATSTVTVTTTISSAYTPTITRGAGRRSLPTDGPIVDKRATDPFAQVKALPGDIIRDGCFLYLYGTVQYPVKTVTPSPKTVTATAKTSTITNTALTTSTNVVSTTSTSAAPTSTVTFATTAPPTTVTALATTVTTTTTMVVTQTYYFSGLFGFTDEYGGIGVQPTSAPGYFYATNSKTTYYPAHNLVSTNPNANFDDPRTGYSSGLLYTSGTNRPGTDYTAVVELASNHVSYLPSSNGLISTPGFDKIFCNLSNEQGGVATCNAANNAALNTLYICGDNDIYLGQQNSATLSANCETIQQLSFQYF